MTVGQIHQPPAWKEPHRAVHPERRRHDSRSGDYPQRAVPIKAGECPNTGATKCPGTVLPRWESLSLQSSHPQSPKVLSWHSEPGLYLVLAQNSRKYGLR